MKEKIKELEKRIEELEKRSNFTYYPPNQIIFPPGIGHPFLHYHDSIPCYRNPCVWC